MTGEVETETTNSITDTEKTDKELIAEEEKAAEADKVDDKTEDAKEETKDEKPAKKEAKKAKSKPRMASKSKKTKKSKSLVNYGAKY